MRTDTAAAIERSSRQQGGQRTGGRKPPLTLLASASGLRQAMLLQEILGTPVALRKSSSDVRLDGY